VIMRAAFEEKQGKNVGPICHIIYTLSDTIRHRMSRFSAAVGANSPEPEGADLLLPGSSVYPETRAGRPTYPGVVWHLAASSLDL
jgi:hypothetical protein